MIKRFYLYIGSLLTGLFLLIFWRNSVAYRTRTWGFRLFKSVIDWSLISLLAWKLPALLVTWCVHWVTFPIKDKATRITLAVFAGMAFNAFSMNVIELLCLCSVFSIDLITGTNGYLRHLEVSKREVRTA